MGSLSTPMNLHLTTYEQCLPRQGLMLQVPPVTINLSLVKYRVDSTSESYNELRSEVRRRWLGNLNCSFKFG